MKLDHNRQAFFALLRAGLWEQEARLVQYKDVDYEKIYSLAKEQAVLGLMAAGFEHVNDVKLPQAVSLNLAGVVLQLEQSNLAMNEYISEVVEIMRSIDIYTLLVKGQGIAQCYERPLWRTNGDVDFFLDNRNYIKARSYFDSIYKKNEGEIETEKHISYTTGIWEVELHGTMRTTLLKKLDKVVDDVQDNIFCQSNVRLWVNGKTQVFLPSPDNDVIIIFSHYLKHFFHGGIGLRQICDWCRLLWNYKDTIDVDLLKHRLKAAEVVSEWKSFAAFAVTYLGMPAEAIPLYSKKKRWKRNADMIMTFVLETGNFGHNRDKSYQKKYSFVQRKTISLWRHTCDSMKCLLIFPLDSLRVWLSMCKRGISAALK